MISDEDREELTAYLDGEIDGPARSQMEARLNRDPALRAEADALKRAWEMLDHLPRTEPSPTFTSQTLDRLTLIRPTNSTTLPFPLPGRRMPWGLVAAAVIGLVLGWGSTNTLLKSKKSRVIDFDDPLLVKELRLVNNLPLYMAVENLEFLQALDQSDRFAADSVRP